MSAVQPDPNNIPKHIAIIMDGNGRWAKQNGKARIYGHHAGVEAVRKVVETCTELGVQYLTLYAFSTENWKRPEAEVNALMELLVRTIRKETPELNKNNVRIGMIGDGHSLPEACIEELNEAKKITENNTGLNLILALSYSGRWEIANALRQIALKVQSGKLHAEDIDENMIGRHLNTAEIPDPELLIRTSGEFRLSNFLLWQTAYTEYYFTETLWPDFDKLELIKAIINYQNRERRFGKTTEQIQIK
ncbi:MAG: isoprenyl transferase [Chitinophagales bacterium]